MLSCYNRGCGKTYDPAENTDESCQHHPGVPFFHDAYKGWSCCNKKCIDFTEFLNMKGCTLSKHSNEKPKEPEKPPQLISEEPEPVQKIRPSMQMLALNRPPLDSPLTKIEPVVAEAVKTQSQNFKKPEAQSKESNSDEIPAGTICKNGGCNFAYVNHASNQELCVFHPGVPIFHEGLKYWSCCQKKTSDFTAFMNQVGCTSGQHKWTKEKNEAKTVQCRWDWHQTGANVIVSIYAKKYDYRTSTVQLNPIRLVCNLKFPEQGNSEFNIDLELRGMVRVDKTVVQMLGTKVEILMPKAETGTWVNLDFPKKQVVVEPETKKEELAKDTEEDSDSDIDLDDLQPVVGAQITNANPDE